MSFYLTARSGLLFGALFFSALYFTGCGEEKKQETICECVARQYESADSALISYIEVVAQKVDIEAQKDFARAKQTLADSIAACNAKAKDFEEDAALCGQEYAEKLDSLADAFTVALQQTIDRKTAEREEAAKKNAANPPKK